MQYQIKMVSVEEVMSTDPLCIREEDILTKAQSLMRETGYRALPVTDEKSGRIMGILSRGNALTVTSRKTNVEVRGVMGHNVVTASPEEDLFSAARKITESGVRQLPVVNQKGKVIGVLSSMDILRSFVDHGYKTVKKNLPEVMSNEVVSCREDDEVSRMWNMMEQSGFGGLPVLDKKGKVKGMVTRMDILRKRSLHIGKESGKSKKTHIIKAMTANPKTITVDSGTLKAAQLMVENKIIRIPVVDGKGNLEGLVDSEDLLKSYLS
ncbi:MAG: hypothetical protein B6U72_02560 [Candidatus Altiarchaeales archaeon ex4484_2]|nr:MAG: hypothetical protein B6U72_02560 [Candidatus Altiarchaeales archaeon ex4484_2]